MRLCPFRALFLSLSSLPRSPQRRTLSSHLKGRRKVTDTSCLHASDKIIPSFPPQTTILTHISSALVVFVVLVHTDLNLLAWTSVELSNLSFRIILFKLCTSRHITLDLMTGTPNGIGSYVSGVFCLHYSIVGCEKSKMVDHSCYDVFFVLQMLLYVHMFIVFFLS